jgi:ABC-type transporter Mla maintaining outer membrane lipid asymmetry ATPase subunit MlaF
MTGPPLVFEDVPLGTGGRTRVSLTVPPRRAVAVVGEVASGLERLGAFALGLAMPPAGRALLFGEEVGRLPRRAALPFRRRAGYVPEGDGLLQNLSLEENVGLPLRFGSTMSEREIHGRVRVILGAFRLAEAARLRPADADDEQRRRAACARALVFDPALVILDQPFDGIGPGAASELLSLARGGETEDGPRRAVFVTSQALPDYLRLRFELRYRVARGALHQDGERAP